MNLFSSNNNDYNNDYLSDNYNDSAVKSKSVIRNISPDKREWIRQESEAILIKNQMLRDKTKQDMFEKRVEHEKLVAYAREKRDRRWKDKTKHSPFAVNLVAEDERIAEENNIRVKDETERRMKMETRKEKAKNEIILKALSEFSDLEALRKEKRAIMEEEQRLKALLSLEKVTVTGKADRLVAERAQRQRKEAKLEYRRVLYKDSLDQVLEEERLALMKKHAMLGNNTTNYINHHNHTSSRTSISYTNSYNKSGNIIDSSNTGAPLTSAAIAAMNIVH